MEQFQKYDISFVVESKLSCGGEVLITKCGNRMAIQEKKIFFGGININNPLFYIDDFRPYFTSVIYYNLVLLRNVFMIHSASYSMNGKGYMIIGDSGCGKSSLTLANILSGGKYLSNDITYLGEKEDKIKIWGLPQVMNLGDLALEWFLREMEKDWMCWHKVFPSKNMSIFNRTWYLLQIEFNKVSISVVIGILSSQIAIRSTIITSRFGERWNSVR